jgi:hypothetical protein
MQIEKGRIAVVCRFCAAAVVASNEMASAKALILGVVVILLALSAALAFESVFYIEVRNRPPEPLAGHQLAGKEIGHQPPLPLRLVDSGGVGIPLAGDWGKDYSHAYRAFHQVILEEPPYVDTAAFERVDRDWRAYVERMRAYGNNAIVLPLLLELIDFKRLDRSGQAASVYRAEDLFRARHAEMRRHFGPLFEWTDRRGMQVFLGADMLSLTPPLHDYLRARAPGTNRLGINTSDPAVWEVYRAGLEELFDELPSIAGLVIRIGEAGALYNTAGWPYRSEMAIRDAASLRAMLHGLLPLFESRGKTLVLRTWSVGVGRLGRLHVDPRLYDAVLGDIDSPALIVSTKFTAGDFFTHLPLNPTLAAGRHRRLVELQARPEFEGFGAFPNFLGDEHARALRVLTAANDRIVGTYLWSQSGGPLRAGPRSLYPVHGFWLWTDANVFVASQLALDRDADVPDLTRRWVASTFGDDARVVDAVTSALATTRTAVREGFYIRPFAERQVRVPGLELPPLMWIFEWDMLGGWHSLLSIVYQGSREDLAAAVEEGRTAATVVQNARRQLEAAFASANPTGCTRLCGEVLRSLEYQETLFETLASWRETFLNYYRWLETGDRDAWQQWTEGRAWFEAASTQHSARFGADFDFPAFDLGSASEAVAVARRGVWAQRAATGLLIGVIVLAGIGSPLGRRYGTAAVVPVFTKLGEAAWTAAMTPWRLGREALDPLSSVAVTAIGLALVGFVVEALAGFTTAWVGVGPLLSIGAVGLAFESTAIGGTGRNGRGGLLVAAVGPMIPGLIVLVAIMAYGGPLGFWYWFWSSPIFRVVVLTVSLAMLLWTVFAMFAARRPEGWHTRVGGLLTAAGAGMLVLTALLPNWVDVLRFLDRPLNFAPATETMLIGLRTYAAVNLDAGLLPWVTGALLVVSGYLLSWKAHRSSVAPE